MNETVGPPGAGQPPSGWQAPGPSGASPPPTLGPYVLQRELGRGGMGVVYLGYDPRMRRPVAIKKIQGQVEPHHLERFQREAQLAGRLRHPGIAQVYEVVPTGPGAPYLVQEFVPGTPLIEVCRAERLSGRRAAEVVRKTCAALEAAHASGVLHRDLKPHNVMLTEGDEPVLLDFGLAKDLGDHEGGLTEAGQMLGTLAYAAPEQLEGAQDIDARADVYGLGAILYQCLSGVAPFSGASQVNVLNAVLTKPVPQEPLREAHRDLSTICLKCLEKEPSDRYASAAEVGADLTRFLEGEPIEARPLSRWARVRRRVGRSKSLLVAVGLLVAAVGAAAFVGTRQFAHEARARQKVEHAAELLQRLEEVRRYRYQPLRSSTAEERTLIESARKELSGIVRELEGLSAEEPRPAPVYLHQGWAHLALFDLAEAKACADAALERDPGLARAHLLRGRALALELVIDSVGAERGAAWRKQLAGAAAEAFGAASELGGQLGPRELAWFALAKEDLPEVTRQLAAMPAHSAAEERALLGALARLPLGVPTRGELAEAEELLDRALAVCPRSLEALTLRGLIRIRLGDHTGARAYLDRAVLLKPDHPKLLRFRAEALYFEGRFEEARVDVDRALKADPDYVLAYATRGVLRQRSGDAGGALADCDEAIRRAPRWASPLVYRASVKRQQRDYGGALSDLDRAAELSSDQRQITVARSDVAVAMEDWPEAERLLTRALEDFPSHGPFLAQRGLVRLKRKAIRAGLADYAAARKAGFERASDLRFVAMAHKALGDTPAALRHLDRALTLAPRDARLLLGRGQLRAESGDLKGARADLDASVTAKPSAPAYYARSSVKRLEDNEAGALEDLTAALALDPKHVGARVARGVLYSQGGNASAARGDFDAALAIDPRQGEALTYRGVLRLHQRDVAGGMADLNRAVDLETRSRYLFFARGQAYKALGRHREAALDFERGLGIDDDSGSPAAGVRAYIQQVLGRPSKH